jgi:hypothetical protein
LVVVAGLAAASLAPVEARAQSGGDPDPRIEATAGLGVSSPYWGIGKPRPFAAAVFDVGGIFARTELDVGWGKPHSAWGGLEAASKLTIGGITLYVGPRISVPHFSLRAGLRDYQSTDTHWLVPRYEYDRVHLDLLGPPRSHYAALDAEIVVDAPLGPGTASLLTSAHGLFGVDPGFYVYEDALHVIVKPPWVFRTRAAWLGNVGKLDDMALGGAVELIEVPNRGATTVRVGPVVAVALTHHLQAIGAAMFVVGGRDELGLGGADLGQIGLRYRWATGDPWPEFP